MVELVTMYDLKREILAAPCQWAIVSLRKSVEIEKGMIVKQKPKETLFHEDKSKNSYVDGFIPHMQSQIRF